RIRERNGGAQWDRSLDKVLRHATPAFVARRADARRGLCGRCALFHRREKTKKEKTATTETGGLTLMEPSLIPPPGRLTNRGHLKAPLPMTSATRLSACAMDDQAREKELELPAPTLHPNEGYGTIASVTSGMNSPEACRSA